MPPDTPDPSTRESAAPYEAAIREAFTVTYDGEQHEPDAEFVQTVAAAVGPLVAAEVAAERERIAQAIAALIAPDVGSGRGYGPANTYYANAARVAREAVDAT